VRLGNRLHHQIWRYYPQLLELTDDVAADWFLDLWAIAPTPAKGEHLCKAAVEQLLKRYRIRRIDAEAVLRNLRQPAIKVAEGVAAAASVHIRSLIVRLHLVNRELRDAERKLDEFCASFEGDRQDDVAILRSLPGIGRINLATLLAEASGPLSRRDYPALRTLSGVAPVTKRSGKSHIVIMRYAAHSRLRNAVYHWACAAVRHDPKSRCHDALNAKGNFGLHPLHGRMTAISGRCHPVAWEPGSSA